MQKGGWLEVEFEYPDGWAITGESGGLTQAYIRVDSKKTNKMEIKWEKIKKGQNIQPHTIVDNFIDSYKKSSKKRKQTEILDQGTLTICEHKAVYAKWRAGAEAIVFSWICNQEKKAFLLGYYLDSDEKWTDVVSWLTRGVLCHTPESYWRYFLSGTRFVIPKGYWLSKRTLLIGRVTLLFKNKLGSSLLLHWSSFARELLTKHGGLKGWYARDKPKEVREVVGSLSSDKLNFAEGGLKATFDASVRKGLLSKTDVHKAFRMWNDVDNNRIFLVCFSGPETNIDDFEVLEKSIGVEI